MSAYLYADDPDGQNRVCGEGEDCWLSATPAARAILDCTEGNNCTAQCGTDGTCTIEGTLKQRRCGRGAGAVAETRCLEANNCELSYRDASCELSCAEANNCTAACEQGADCHIDCRSANSCDNIRCTGGASCLLLCGSGSNCRFDECWHGGGAIQCADGSRVCGRPCP